jgi:hypothetical protein
MSPCGGGAGDLDQYVSPSAMIQDLNIILPLQKSFIGDDLRLW